MFLISLCIKKQLSWTPLVEYLEGVSIVASWFLIALAQFFSHGHGCSLILYLDSSPGYSEGHRENTMDDLILQILSMLHLQFYVPKLAVIRAPIAPAYKVITHALRWILLIVLNLTVSFLICHRIAEPLWTRCFGSLYSFKVPCFLTKLIPSSC